MPSVGEMLSVAGAGASLALAGGGEFLAAADRAEGLAVAVRGGTSSVTNGGEARMTGGGDIGTSGTIGGGGGEPLAVVPWRLTFSQGSATPGLGLLVAAGGESWLVTDGGGASESGGASEL